MYSKYAKSGNKGKKPGATHYTRRRRVSSSAEQASSGSGSKTRYKKYYKKSGNKSKTSKRTLTPEQIQKMQEGRRLAEEKKRDDEITKRRLEALSEVTSTIQKNERAAEWADKKAFDKRNRYLEKHRSGGGRGHR